MSRTAHTVFAFGFGFLFFFFGYLTVRGATDSSSSASATSFLHRLLQHSSSSHVFISFFFPPLLLGGNTVPTRICCVSPITRTLMCTHSWLVATESKRCAELENVVRGKFESLPSSSSSFCAFLLFFLLLSIPRQRAAGMHSLPRHLTDLFDHHQWRRADAVCVSLICFFCGIFSLRRRPPPSLLGKCKRGPTA